ncbi:S16 family serine protease [Calditrichota bacterium LG25]
MRSTSFLRCQFVQWNVKINPSALRHGIKRIILPAENKPDVREMSKELLEGLELVFVKDYEQIYDLLFKK